MFKGLRFFLQQGWKYDKKYILWRIIYQLVHSLIPILAALAPKYIIDELTGQQRISVLLFYVGILVTYTLVAGIVSNCLSLDSYTRRGYVSTAFTTDLNRLLTQVDFERLESPSFRDQKEKAEKFLFCDWHGFGYLLDMSLNVIGKCITLAGISAIILTLDLWVVVLFVVMCLISTWASNWAEKKAKDLTYQIVSEQRHVLYYNSVFQDGSFGKEIRLNGLGDWMVERYAKSMQRCDATVDQRNRGYMKANAITAGTTFIQECAAYGYLIGAMLKGFLSVGDFTMYLGAVTAFSKALSSVMESLAEIRLYDGYYEELDTYLNLPQTLRISGNQKVSPGTHRLEFREVGFRYPGQQEWALRNVNITLHPGERLAVVGENGAGKTTFVKLLCRLYDPTEGQILLDGMDIREYDYDSYLSLFGTVLQDYQLFSVSLRDNVALALPSDDCRVEKVLRQVGLGDKLNRLPKGIHTHVTRLFEEDGFEPSGGEGQKIALARALYRDAPIMVLDEPAAALDPRAEYELYRQFDGLVQDKTAVYISHRLSSARFCHQIAVFSKGQLAEYGTHQMLLAQKGLYAELFGLQAQYYND